VLLLKHTQLRSYYYPPSPPSSFSFYDTQDTHLATCVSFPLLTRIQKHVLLPYPFYSSLSSSFLSSSPSFRSSSFTSTSFPSPPPSTQFIHGIITVPTII